MEKNLERYYTEFKRPPLAPTFTPTEEEFSDPISYVAKIKPEAEKFGLIKIIPPKSFHPPFCIDSAKFEFTPRVQRLNEIDALFRLRIIFINKLVKFWQIQGQQFRIPYIDNKYIDLYRLRELVEENGGHKKVSQTRKWSQIAKTLGFKPNAGPSMKYHYNKWIYAFDMNTASENAALDEQPSTSAVTNTKVDENQNEERNSPKTRSQSRMMAGAGKKTKPVPSLDQSSIKGLRTPIESVVCAKCGSGDDEARLLLCETCDSSLHTYCTNPPMSTVPKGEWRCQKCVANALKSVSTDFGFADSNQHFNLETFGRWANTYKQQYFNQGPLNVSSEKVEQEFWRNVIDIDKSVQVKYGADLISSKVGSGFPRREDAFRGIDAKDKQFYANHPWNLNNLPKLRESVLSHMDMDISGMMVPWVYVGMLFSTFCWHVEDHWTYSINYNHLGERKIWYGIPGDEAEKFDNVMKESAPELFREQKDLLHHMTTALNPRYLIDHEISVYTVHQNAGEFVITFPRAYHSGYNEGLNFAEAVNFAPSDWLRMGRQCLDNYANVRRNCVFSHEELIMKMVFASHKMSIGMCTSTLEELSWIVAKETEFRKKLTAEGLRESQFCKFEELADDDRACIVCRTTLFSSGLVCQHEGRIVCTNHISQLCDKCQVNNCCLKFRYTLEDLVPMIKRLSERTNAFFEWKKSAIEITTSAKEMENEQKISQSKDRQRQKKIDVNRIRILADQWKNSRFPHCEEIHHMNEILIEFDRLAINIKKILNRKIRLRDQTRCQKPDTRCKHSEFLALYEQLKQSMFEEKELEIGLEEILNKREEWKQRVRKTLSDGFHGTQSIDILYQLIYQAEEEFNIRMESEELDNLKTELSRRQWLSEAQNALELIDRAMNSSETLTIKSKERQRNEKFATTIEEKEQTQLNLLKLQKLIANSSKWSESCKLVHSTNKKLEEMFAKGKVANDVASQFLSNAESQGTEKAEECWQIKLSAANWNKSDAMDKFFVELEIGRQILKNYSSFSEEAFTLKMLEQLNQQCSNSLFERNGHRHKRVNQLLVSVNTFVERIRTIFQKAVSYYNLFEIITGRSDLPALVEGDPLPLSHFVSAKYSDNWQQLRIFDTNTQLLAHLNAITEQQLTILHALRLANEERPLKETCICAMDEHPISLPEHSKRISGSLSASTSNNNEMNRTTINCFICNAKFHENCALWDPFLSRLPVGLYLCPRCIRSRRPCIEDVEAACSSSELPENCMEKVLVQNLVHRSTKTFTQLQRLLHAIPKGIELSTITEATRLALSEWLTMALSVEVFDAEIYKMLTTSAYFDLFPITELQKNVWQKIQKKTINAEPLPILFPVGGIIIHNQSSNRRISGTTKRHSTTKTKRKSSEKLKRTEDEIDQMDGGNDDSLMKIDDGMKNEEKSVARKKHRNGNGDIEKCAADFCLKPYSEFTRWIQCEAGCERWYHFCCVGISVRGAQLISSYCCYKCSSAAIHDQ